MRFKADRDAAFTVFMTEQSPTLIRTAWFLCGNADAAAELVQAALVKTYVAWPRVRPDGALAYTRRVLVNSATDRHRSAKRETPSADPPDLVTTEPHLGVDDRDQLWRLLATLTERQRAIVVLRYLADLPERDVADALKISVGTVKSTTARALASLRELGAESPSGQHHPLTTESITERT